MKQKQYKVSLLSLQIRLRERKREKLCCEVVQKLYDNIVKRVLRDREREKEGIIKLEFDLDRTEFCEFTRVSSSSVEIGAVERMASDLFDDWGRGTGGADLMESAMAGFEVRGSRDEGESDFGWMGATIGTEL